MKHFRNKLKTLIFAHNFPWIQMHQFSENNLAIKYKQTLHKNKYNLWGLTTGYYFWCSCLTNKLMVQKKINK